jgi:hypothetical protein
MALLDFGQGLDDGEDTGFRHLFDVVRFCGGDETIRRIVDGRIPTPRNVMPTFHAQEFTVCWRLLTLFTTSRLARNFQRRFSTKNLNSSDINIGARAAAGGHRFRVSNR